MIDVVVVGAGIAGLSCAQRIADSGREVCLVEASGHVGGMIQSVRFDDYLLERGPNTIQKSTPQTEAIIDRLGLGRRVVEAGASGSRRYIVKRGRLVEVPAGLIPAVRTPLFSIRGKLRILAEPFRPTLPDSSADESVASFVRRRMGKEFLDYAVDPFVSGVHSGDPERLSIRHAFPQMKALEEAGGSLIRGAFNTRKERRALPPPRWKMFSFPGGLSELTTALHDRLGDKVRLSTPVTDIEPVEDVWRVHSPSASFDCRSLVWAAPPRCFPAESPVRMPTHVMEIVHPPLATVHLGYPAAAVGHSLDGFGFLVPFVERDVTILGALFSSSLFDGRAPEGHVLLTCFVGGRRQPDLTGLPDDELLCRTESDINRLLHISDAPTFRSIHRRHEAIPQYEIGYGDVKSALSELESDYPGIFFCGNYRDGVSVTKTVDSGIDAARRALTHIGASDNVR